MNAKLRALLLLVFTTGAAILYYIPRAAPTNADFLDAGVTVDCNFRRVSCSFFDDGAGGGGLPAYSERTFVAAFCGSGERVVPRKVARIAAGLGNGAAPVDLDVNCRVVATVGAGAFDINEDPPTTAGACACWQIDAGTCTYADGGQNRGHNEMAPGDWAGAGCVAKPCGEVAGFTSRPAACPL